MLYPTKQNGEEWFINMENPTSDARFDPKSSITKNPDGSWKMQSDKVRMNVFTSTGYDQSKIPSTNHAQLSSKGYMLSPTDWRDVEITGYVKVNSINADDNFAWYARGGKHGDSDGCEGVSYKGDLFYSGKAQVAKEQLHVNYDKSEEKQVIDSIQGKWIGFKFVMYNVQQNGKTAVKMENWVDQTGVGNWAKVFEIVDSGGWGRQGTSCAGVADQIITWGGPVATFRWDSATDVDFKFMSVREIDATGGPAASGAAAGALGDFSSGIMAEQEGSAMEEEGEEVDRNQKVATSGNYVYVVWTDPPPIENDDIFFKRSTDGGLSFEPEIKLTGTAASSSDPDIAAYGSEVYVVWREGDRGKTDVFIRKSNDNGESFGPPIDLSNSTTGSSSDPTVALSTSGEVAVAWSETNNTADGSNNDTASEASVSNIVYRASSDSGTSFDKPINLSNNPQASLISSVQPEIAMSPDGDPLVVWSSGDEDDRKVFYTNGSIDDKGINPDSFSSPVSLNNNVSDSSSFAPRIAISNKGEVNVVWKDNGKSGRSDVFSVQSTDDQTSFSNPLNISNDTKGSGDPDVSVSKDGRVHAVWSGTSPGDNEVFLATRQANSSTFEDISILSNSSESMSFNPQLALSESGEINVVWNDQKINATSQEAAQQNISSGDNTTNIRPTIVLKKVQPNLNVTAAPASNNTAAALPSSSTAVLPPQESSPPTLNGNPTVNAGLDQIIRLNETGQQALTLTLNGSATDPENEPLAYRWNQINGTLLDLVSAALPQTRISVPIATLINNNNTFTFELAAYDNKGGTGKDKTTIQILKNDTSTPPGVLTQSTPTAAGTVPLPGNIQQAPTSTGKKPPNADARATPSIASFGQQVSLVATASNDEDGTISSYSWEQLNGEAVTLLGKDKSMAAFNAPNEETTLEFRLTITDNQGQTDSSLVQVSVRGSGVGSNSGGVESSAQDGEEDEEDTDTEED
jgi:hypothetical protein